MTDKPPESSSKGKTTEEWGTQLGVILAVAGSAVGLGNFLRFPGLAASNGGGAFMIPYFLALLLVGIPLCWAEWTMGRYGGRRGFNSSPGIFMAVCRNPLARFAGVPALIIPLMIYMYYVVIEAWCLSYAYQYLTGTVMTVGNYTEHFNNYTGQHADFSLFDGGHKTLLLSIAGCFVLNFFLIYNGISKGIETFCKIAMPMMLICAICVLVRVLTLPPQDGRSVLDGLGFMWNPKFEELAKPGPWGAATGQIFFSLSVGFGVILNYASYLKKKDDIALSSLTSCSVNELFEVCLGGMITVTAGFMFMGLAVSANTGSSFDMGFKALPEVFNKMPAGQLFGFMWFLLLFLAAVTSSISMLQPVIAFFEEGLGLKRHASVAILGLISSIGSFLVCIYSKKLVALSTLDYWAADFLICVLALIQAVVYSCVFGISHAKEELELGAKLKVPDFVLYFVLRYISPAYLILLMLFMFGSLENGIIPKFLALFSPDNRVALISFSFMLLVITFITLLVHIAGVRWIKEGKMKNVLPDGTLKPND